MTELARGTTSGEAGTVNSETWAYAGPASMLSGCTISAMSMINGQRGLSALAGSAQRAYGLIVTPALYIDGFAQIEHVMIGPLVDSETPSAQVRAVVRDTPGVVGTDRLISDIIAWTGLSLRAIAKMIGTSHTTTRRLALGEVSYRSSAFASRLRSLHGVVERLHFLASSSAVLAEALRGTRFGTAPEDLIQQGDFVSAYRRAMVELNGPAEGMLGAPPVDGRTATYPVDIDDLA